MPNSVVVGGRISKDLRDWLVENYGANASGAIRRLIEEAQRARVRTGDETLDELCEALQEHLKSAVRSDGRIPMDTSLELIGRLNELAAVVIRLTEVFAPSKIDSG